MQHFLLAVHTVPDAPTPSENDQHEALAAVEVFNALLKQNSAWVYAGSLMPGASAEIVDATHEEVSTTNDGAAAAGEHLGGFWIVRAPDHEAAVRWAAKASAACGQPIHLRPFQDDQE